MKVTFPSEFGFNNAPGAARWVESKFRIGLPGEDLALPEENDPHYSLAYACPRCRAIRTVVATAAGWDGEVDAPTFAHELEHDCGWRGRLTAGEFTDS